MLLSVLGQVLLDVLLLLWGSSVDWRVSQLDVVPWLWGSDKDNRDNSGNSQVVGRHGFTEDVVGGTHFLGIFV